ncbi:hypothetical protein [Streptomyces sp. G45]|uniref:hypothetical protein n=1 Tax=Streptomyces sp. G45 TaxID=3406627 RepID=UPI003C150F69
MTTLLIHDGAADPLAPTPRTGGVPLVPEGFAWPECGECEGAMQFLAHLPLDTDVVAVFQCQNDPGLCDEWDATGGGNKAFRFAAEGLVPAVVPEEGETRLGAVSALRAERVAADGFAEALDQWADGGGEPRLVQGQLGGAPAWVQGDETPDCPACTAPMAFAAQLEEGHDHATAANFGGGGIGYVFTCGDCREAAFLWQC